MSVSTQSPAVKKFRIGDFLMSIIPLLIMLCLNTAATMPAIFIGVFENRKNGSLDLSDTASILSSDAAQTALAIGFIVYAITTIIIFYFWYKKAFLKNLPVIPNKEIFTVKNIVLTILGALGTSSIISFFLIALNALSPSLMESYSETMNSAGLGSNIIITVIYACILGPIAEELMFRGVTQAYLVRSNAHAAVVIFFQALLFGIAHMNLVQSSYAVLLGLFLGFLRYKSGNLRITIFAHIVFNIFGSYGLTLIDMLPDGVEYVLYGLLAVAGIASIVFTAKTPARNISKVNSASVEAI